MSLDVTKIELAKALKSIKAIATPDQFESVKKIFIQPGGEESVMNSVYGLSEEDEFALLTKLMETATHIIGFEQRPLTKAEITVADYYLSIKPGCSLYGKSKNLFSDFKCVIDVKSTQKDLFKIGGGKLQKLRNFADLMGLPLFFAVRFLRFKNNALWAIVEDKREDTFLHVDYSHIIDGVRHVFWDEYFLFPNPKLVIVSKFSKSSTEPSVLHPEYGSQIEISFYEEEKLLLTLDGTDAFIKSALMEPFNLEETEAKVIDSDTTLQYLKPSNEGMFLADLIYKTNRLPVDELGQIVYDASKLIVRSDTDAHDKLVNRSVIEKAIAPLIRSKVLFIGEIKDHLSIWKALGGKE